MDILCVMRMHPSLDGHGGSQRAWHTLKALCDIGMVHLVLLPNFSHGKLEVVSLDPLRSLVSSITVLKIPEWQPSSEPSGKLLHRGWTDLARVGTHNAPRFSRASLVRIAEQLPIRRADVIFTQWLPAALIFQDLIRFRLVQADKTFADLVDLLSIYARRRLATVAAREGGQTRLLGEIEVALLRRAESRIAALWDKVSLCAPHDVELVNRRTKRQPAILVPNIVDRRLLPKRQPDGFVRLLFVGNLSFEANIKGLRAFIADAWPRIQLSLPTVRLSVVGMNPGPEVMALAGQDGVSIHADVESLIPFYEDCDMVIAPIFLASGTRVKIIEAMAYGRPIVSTITGAEGLGLRNEESALLVEDMETFGRAVVRLGKDSDLQMRLSAAARLIQEMNFGARSMSDPLREALQVQP